MRKKKYQFLSFYESSSVLTQYTSDGGASNVVCMTSVMTTTPTIRLLLFDFFFDMHTYTHTHTHPQKSIDFKLICDIVVHVCILHCIHMIHTQCILCMFTYLYSNYISLTLYLAGYANFPPLPKKIYLNNKCIMQNDTLFEFGKQDTNHLSL